MAHMQDQFAIYDDVYDALRAAIQALGGTKAVAVKLWSSKAPTAAQTELLDALNRERPRKLTPEEFMQILAWAREAGFHSLMSYMSDQVGYEAKPIEPQDELAKLQRAFVDSVQAQRGIADRIERLTQSPIRVAK